MGQSHPLTSTSTVPPFSNPQYQWDDLKKGLNVLKQLVPITKLAIVSFIFDYHWLPNKFTKQYLRGQIFQPAGQKAATHGLELTRNYKVKIFPFESLLTFSGHLFVIRNFLSDIQDFTVLTEVWKVNHLFLLHHKVQGPIIIIWMAKRKVYSVYIRNWGNNQYRFLLTTCKYAFPSF